MKFSFTNARNLNLLALALAAAAVVGCGSGKPAATVFPDPSLPTGLPAPAAAGPVNTYSGAQSPGAWSLALDNTGNTFSYQPITYPAAATTGSLQASGGFSILGGTGLGTAALAYEDLGQAAVLRPGSATSSPVVFSVPQTQCYAITGRMRFQYIGMFSGTVTQGSPDVSGYAPVIGYGSVVASTDATGKNWQFQNLQGGVWPVSASPVSTIVAGPTSFTGTCSSTNGEAAIALSGTSLLNSFWDPQIVTAPTSGTQSNIWIGPSGFFAVDQSVPLPSVLTPGDPTQTSPNGASGAGMAEPAAQLSTSAMVAGVYLGMLYEAAYDNNGVNAPGFSAPVGFGQVVVGSGTTLTGGVFPNDAVTSAPNSDTTITLGSQDATLNGLYANVKVTVSDPSQNCADFNGTVSAIPGLTLGVDANGYPTCTFPGVAVAGNPEGKYAIFVNSYNWAASYGGQPMQVYLFQQ